MKNALPLLIAFSLCLASCQDNTLKVDERPNEEINEPEPGPPVQQQVLMHFGSSIAGFYEALPASYRNYKYKKYPLLINITGAGERGDGSTGELKAVLRPYTPAKLIDAKQFPWDFKIDGQYYAFIVLSVQMTTNRRALPADIDALLTYAKNTYRVDESRIYLTGISLGGGTVWDYVVESDAFARNIAAITPMAGKSVGPTKAKAKIMADADLPVWAFHSEFDTAVPSIYTKNYVNWINDFKPGLARMTLFPDSTHICWRWSYDPTYKESDSVNVYEWMLMQHRAVSH
jgi:dienelactone hydrolase